MKKTALSLLIVLTAGIPAIASFERQSGNARSVALGGAFTGLADSSDAIYFNPAGLGRLSRTELNGSYGKLYAGLDDGSNLGLSNITLAYPLRSIDRTTGTKKNLGTLGVGVNIFDLAGSYSESMLGLFYGKQIGTKIAVGGGVKYLQVGYGSNEYTPLNGVFSAGTAKSNVSADAGILFSPSKSWSLGLAVKDLNSPDMGLKYPDPVDASVSLGGAWRREDLNIASNIDVQGAEYKVVVGGEKYVMAHRFALRAGFGIGSKKFSQLNTGIGYEGDNIFVDYAFYYPLSGLTDIYGSHQISFGYRFGNPDQEAREAARKLYDESVKLIEQGDYARADTRMKAAIDAYPKEGSYVSMEKKLAFIMKYAPNVRGGTKYSTALRRGIATYLTEGSSRDAVMLLMYAYSLKPEDKNAEKLTKAVARECNIDIPESARTWDLVEQKLFQALDRFNEKKYDECIKLCEEVLFLAPDNAMAYKRLGSAFYVLRDYAQARKNWQRVLEVAPKDDEDVPEIRRLMQKLPK